MNWKRGKRFPTKMNCVKKKHSNQRWMNSKRSRWLMTCVDSIVNYRLVKIVEILFKVAKNVWHWLVLMFPLVLIHASFRIHIVHRISNVILINFFFIFLSETSIDRAALRSQWLLQLTRRRCTFGGQNYIQINGNR